MSSLPVNPAELLAAMAAGDQRALDSLYRAWSSRVRVFVRLQLAGSCLDAHAIADEVTVDVFHDVWRAPMRYDGRVAFGTWLLTLARNKAISQLRRHGQRVARETTIDDTDSDAADAAALAAAQYDPGPMALQETLQQRHAVLRCLQRLRNPLQRESLTLWALDDLSVADIAQIQQAPQGTIKTRLFHGRSNLRQCMERWFAQGGGRHD
ncbi:RNA polymerase sigma factor [Janthinobacterium aquaticum]|uniref:RNA polymerase sigma factor n=1 Tax=Janthinobacterium sp. FT58W TaxID=2654254 RepID=UPI0012651A43|nr:RNA polymerase sigma factor [Janthinobacterium sp. FT58W]KAB8041862.1 sigma-70 family RNA polymerase sigma factor [Janthinobacterium sp. FT58W]